MALFLDFDGTLVEIAPTPETILVPAGLAGRLESLSHRLGGRLALVSGRSTANIAAHLGTLAVARAGSHGVERVNAQGRPIGPDPAPLPAELANAMRSFAAGHPGVEYEAKSLGAALHYRAAPQHEHAAITFAERQAVSHGLWVKLGKCVVELVNRGVDKASAVRAFMAEEPFAGALPVFIGSYRSADASCAMQAALQCALTIAGSPWPPRMSSETRAAPTPVKPAMTK